MSEIEPGTLPGEPMTSMEICIRVAYVQRLGSWASADLMTEVASLEEGLPDPCRLCPRRAVTETDELSINAQAQPGGVPCMLPGEALIRSMRAILDSHNGHKKTGI